MTSATSFFIASTLRHLLEVLGWHFSQNNLRSLPDVRFFISLYHKRDKLRLNRCAPHVVVCLSRLRLLHISHLLQCSQVEETMTIYLDLPDENLLITAAQRGDLNAFNTLILHYQNAVYSVIYRILGDFDNAEDATQDTFITAFRRLETYRGGNFRAWLMRVAINISYSLLRYQKRRPSTSLYDLGGENFDDDLPIPDPMVTPEQAVQDKELRIAIQNCINSLSAEQRVALVMRDIEGYSYQEIADSEAAQIGTIKSRLSRARIGLCRCLQQHRELLPIGYPSSNK